jgi:hypothetical protein
MRRDARKLWITLDPETFLDDGFDYDPITFKMEFPSKEHYDWYVDLFGPLIHVAEGWDGNPDAFGMFHDAPHRDPKSPAEKLLMKKNVFSS